jgi:hypothetical protein
MKDTNPLAALKAQGFRILPNIFPPEFLDRTMGEISRFALRRSQAGVRHALGDESTSDNGPLRVLPGTHNRGVLRRPCGPGIEHDRVGRRVRGPERRGCRHASSRAAFFIEITTPGTPSGSSYRVRCLGIDCQSFAAGDCLEQ